MTATVRDRILLRRAGVSLPQRLTSVYEFRCANCNAEIETVTGVGVCLCGVAYRVEWQAKYTPPKRPPVPSLENGGS